MWNWFTALMWEKWRRIRVPFVILCIGPAVSQLLSIVYVYLAHASIDYTETVNHVILARDMEIKSLSLFGVGALMLVSFLLFIHGQRNDLHLNMNVTHFKLPIRSSWLALTQLFFGCLVLILFTAICFSPLLIPAMIGGQPMTAESAIAVELAPPDVTTEFVAMACYFLLRLLPAYLLAQTLCWWVGPISTVAAIVALAGLWLPAAMAATMIWREYEIGGALLLAGGVLAVAPLLCVVALHLQRNGVLGPMAIQGLLGIVQRDSGATADYFPSAEAAHRWYEWRRRAWILPLVFTVVALSNLALALIAPGTFCGLWGEPPGNNFRLGNSPIPYFPFILEQTQFLLFMCALAVGLIVSAFTYREHLSGVATFYFTKPVSTRILARARGRAFVRAWLISSAVLLAALLPSLIVWTPELPHWATGLGLSLDDGSTSYFVLGALWAITLLGVFIMTWAVFTLGIPLLGHLVLWNVCLLLLELVVFRESDADTVFLLRKILGSGVLLSAAILAGVMTYVARRKRLLDRKDAARFILAWPLIAVCLIIGQAWEFGLPSYPSTVIPIVFTALLAPVVTLPFALWPLIIEWQRHR